MQFFDPGRDYATLLNFSADECFEYEQILHEKSAKLRENLIRLRCSKLIIVKQFFSFSRYPTI
jgi:hypothetical protein